MFLIFMFVTYSSRSFIYFPVQIFLLGFFCFLCWLFSHDFWIEISWDGGILIVQNSTGAITKNYTFRETAMFWLHDYWFMCWSLGKLLSVQFLLSFLYVFIYHGGDFGVKLTNAVVINTLFLMGKILPVKMCRFLRLCNFHMFLVTERQ